MLKFLKTKQIEKSKRKKILKLNLKCLEMIFNKHNNCVTMIILDFIQFNCKPLKPVLIY